MITAVAIHKVGNKGQQEPLFISEQLIATTPELNTTLEAYFLNSFKQTEYFHFHHDAGLNLHEVYQFAQHIFKEPEQLLEQSALLARHLYQQSTHPKIKGGEFYVVCFKELILHGEPVNAVGLFKTEHKDTFLKVAPQDTSFDLHTEEGIALNKLDKGCLIYERDAEQGYIVAVVDQTNKGSEAQYWTDDFLQLRQIEDDYFHTENTLELCKQFIVKQLPEHFEVSKADQADYLNRSLSFFKEREDFQLQDFSREVLQQPEVIQRFQEYRSNYEEERDLQLADQFTIAGQAVKRQTRSYKSVIKLDKNFHIYVHGDRNLIEQGEDDQGRFYKIYFKEEF